MDIFRRLFKRGKVTVDADTVLSDCHTQHKRSGMIMQRKLLFSVALSDYNPDEQIHFCMMYHPLRSACFTPTFYPVDEVCIIYKGLLKEQYIYNAEQGLFLKDEWIVVLSDTNIAAIKDVEAIDIKAEWDKVAVYNSDVCDALESWDFIFSKNPIDANMYLDEYIQKTDNMYARKKDLIEQKKRNEKLQRFFE